MAVDDVVLGFVCEADIKNLHLVGLEGRERVGQLFEFDLMLMRWGPPLTSKEVSEIVGHRCTLAFGPRPGDRIHGILSTLTHLDGPRHLPPRYIARVVPEIAQLALGRRSAIYQDLTVPELATQVLQAYGLRAGIDFEVRVQGASTTPKREYIVQYQESDWDFLTRWFEHEGMFTFFEHSEAGVLFVIADANEDAHKIDDPSTISYRERNDLGTGGLPTIWDVRVTDRQVPKRVAVVDYNYRRPAKPVAAVAEVSKLGFGQVALYGDHVKDETEAGAIAKIRAQEIGASARIFKGTTDCARIRAGHRLELENHPVAEYDEEYFVVAVHHRAGIPLEQHHASRKAGEEPKAEKYIAEFEAIPSRIPFRPARVTEWPSIHGVLHGHIQSDGSGQVAEIDEVGRYKVRLPFDVGEKRGMQASRWIRKAQSYAGAGYGMHFPLHMGTEVLVAHLDGDPDRPIIVGAVPNTTTPGPVARPNATQSVIQTASGIRVELEDIQS